MPLELGQQRLLEVPPAKRVQVPVGHTAYLGVDPSSKVIAVARVRGDGARDVRSVYFPKREGAARLHGVYAATFSLARDLAEDEPPGVVVVEQPSGKPGSVSTVLIEAVAIIKCALFRGVLSVTGREPYVADDVPPGKWKSVACGRGNLYKPKPAEVRAGATYGVADWAALNGYDGKSWDEADAWGIAEYARKTYGLVER